MLWSYSVSIILSSYPYPNSSFCKLSFYFHVFLCVWGPLHLFKLAVWPWVEAYLLDQKKLSMATTEEGDFTSHRNH